MKFKDLIIERKVTLDGRVFNSEKEAGFYLGSIGKEWQEIVKLLGVPERMAKWYASTGRKKGSGETVKPEPSKPIVEPKQIKNTPEPIIKTSNTALPIIFDSNLDKEKMLQITDVISKAKFDNDMKLPKDGEINFTVKDYTFAVAVVNGKPVYTPEDIPNTPSLNKTTNDLVKRCFQNSLDDVIEAFKYLPQNLIDLYTASKTFEQRKTFIKSSEKKNGGLCRPGLFEIHWGKANKFREKSLGTLRHELFHMLDGFHYEISYKIPDIVKSADMKRMRTPSIALDKKVEEILEKTDFGSYRIEANKILANYNLSVEELEKFVKYDKNDTFEMKSRGAFMFALYLSQGDLTSAFKSLYQSQVIDLYGKAKWVNMLHHGEVVYGYISDFIGSMTNNRVLGYKDGGSGHTNAYYKKRAMTRAKNCELIADYGALISCGEGEIAMKILKAFAPYTVNSIETILKAQTYFKHEGSNVNYI